MKEIRLGIIGTNFVSDWLCESVRLTEGIRNHAVYSRTEEKGTEFAEKHDIQNVYTNLEQFFSSDIDAVYIASPNFLHFEQAINAMLHGKHVLLEKPAAHNEYEFDLLLKTAEENNVILLEAMRPMHDPAIEIIRKGMGQIGKIRRAVFDFCQYSSRYDKFKAGEILNAFNPEMGNAALMDIGVYAMNCAVNLFGEPESLYSKSVILHNGMEGMGSVILDYSDRQVEVVYSKITDSVTPSVIIGEEGYLTIKKVSTLESAELKLRNEESIELITERPENNMIYEVSDFVKCINGSITPEKYNNITKTTLRLMDEVRRQNGIVFPKEIKN